MNIQNNRYISNDRYLKKIKYQNNLILPITALLFWFFFPILSIIPFLYLLSLKYLHLSKTNQIILIILISLSFGLISYVVGSGGTSYTDMIRYRQVFGLMPYRNLNELWIYGSNIPFILLNWFIANLISSNDQIFSLIIISIAYYFNIISIVKLCNKFIKKKYHAIVIIGSIVFIISIIIPFELLKQYLSFSFFLYGLTLKLLGKKYALFWIFLSLLMHISSFFYLPIYFYNLRLIRKNILIIFLLSLFLSLFDIISFMANFADLPLFIALNIDERLSAYSNEGWGDGFGGSKRYYLIFLFYIIQISPIIIYYYRHKNLRANISIIFILSFCILLMNMSNVANFARLTRTLYIFQILALIFSINYINFKYRKLWIYFILGCLFSSNLIEFIKAIYNPYYHLTYMGNDYLSLAFSNVIDIFNYHLINPI